MNRGGEKPYDLEERTALFGEIVISFAKTIPQNIITQPLISQIVRSATSVGANYCEADDASSKKEFRQKIGYCRKEARTGFITRLATEESSKLSGILRRPEGYETDCRETKHWIRMIVKACPELRSEAISIWNEAKELHLIFAAILRKRDT
ncbi:MAG: four helix bundle protein [Planctomycetota bacterium]|nr:four helix bundle protein [Planctomycetota bacterium]MDA1213523.1 four helix bundle protein [Planctomycetota bacterium]